VAKKRKKDEGELGWRAKSKAKKRRKRLLAAGTVVGGSVLDPLIADGAGQAERPRETGDFLLDGRDDAAGLQSLGSGDTTYNLEKRDGSILECFANPQPDRNYEVRHKFKEFTSVCPKTGQPDFAKLLVEYTPNRHCVETKSLKLYLFSYRNEGAFMERICNQICTDLTETMNPKWLRVTMTFRTRGGIETKVTAFYDSQTRVDSVYRKKDSE